MSAICFVGQMSEMLCWRTKCTQWNKNIMHHYSGQKLLKLNEEKKQPLKGNRVQITTKVW